MAIILSSPSRIAAGQWRWRWDLNPRMSCPITRFRVLRGTVHQRFTPVRHVRLHPPRGRWRTVPDGGE